MKKFFVPDVASSVLSAGAPAVLWQKILPAATALGRALFAERLTGRERCAQAAILFTGAPEFVSAVVDALRAMPELFPDAPSAQELRQQQDDALDLRLLGQLLRELAELADDAYLRRQHRVLRRAREVVARHQQEGCVWDLPEKQRLAHLRRSVQLFPALQLLREQGRGGRKWGALGALGRFRLQDLWRNG